MNEKKRKNSISLNRTHQRTHPPEKEEKNYNHEREPSVLIEH